MSKWIRNLRSVLDDRPVVLLHGNVRDRYIDEEGSVFENLTKLLEDIARQLPMSFSRLVFYDPAGRERVIDLSEPSDPKVAEKPTNQFADSEPQVTSRQQEPPA